MALFGRKSKDAASPPATTDASVVTAPDPAVADGSGDAAQVASPKGKNAKSSKPPRTPKTRTVKSGTIIGLNIGNSYIKAVEVTSKAGELTITAMGAVPTPPESISNGVVLSVNALSGALKDLWRTAGFKSKTVITSVAGNGALIVRVIEVPKMTDGELQDNMKVDADRYIPFPPSEVIMDFKALRDLPTDPDAPNMEVLLAAAQREIIDLHIKTVQSARLDPRAIDVEPVAAVRALEVARVRATGDTYVDYNDVSALVNVGATGTEISVLRGDIVVFTRGVPTGGDAVTRAIAETFGMPLHEAEQVKVQFADAMPPQGLEGQNDGMEDQFSDFNDDFGAFGLTDETQPVTFEDFTAPLETNSAPAAAASDDPFDLDFFNQGPKQDEPGSGHGQKEGGDNKPDPFDFSFSFEDSPAPTPASPESASPDPSGVIPAPGPVAAAPASKSAVEPLEFDFAAASAAIGTPPLDEENPALLPSHEEIKPEAVQRAGGTESATTPTDEKVLPTRVVGHSSEVVGFTPSPLADWEDESLLPSVDENLGKADTSVIGPAASITDAGSDAALLPSHQTGPIVAEGDAVATPLKTEDAEVLPSIAVGGWVPSAFDFSDLDLPSIDTAPPAAVTPVVASAPTSPGAVTMAPETAPQETEVVSPAVVSPAVVSPAVVSPAVVSPAVVSPAVVPPAAAAGFSLLGGSGGSAASAPSATVGGDTEAAEVAAPAPPAPSFSFSFSEAPPVTAPVAPVAPPVQALEDPPVEAMTPPLESEPLAADSFAFNMPEDVPDAPLGVGTTATAAVPENDETFLVNPAETIAPEAQAEDEDDFDLDAIFGTGTEQQLLGENETQGSALDETLAIGSDDTFDLSSLGPETASDFALMEGDSAGLDTFGAGLVDVDGVAGVDPIALYNCIQPVIEELVNEVRRSLEFHLSRYPDATISTITLLGGGGELLNLDTYMTQMLGVPTRVADPFANFTVTAPKLPPEYAHDNGPLCTVALGLALRDFVV